MRVGFSAPYLRTSFTSLLSAPSLAALARGSLSRNGLGLGNPPSNLSVCGEKLASDVGLPVTGHVDVLRVLPLPEAPLSNVHGVPRVDLVGLFYIRCAWYSART